MPKLPLLVHLVFHPGSESALALARHIHRQLNDDVVVPGLRVPTVFCPISDGRRPPAGDRLDLAEHSAVVPLADDRLSIDEEWCRFVADLWTKCQNASHCCIPFQLSPHAYPLHEKLAGVSFARAHLVPEGGRRNAYIVRRLVIELCRFLLDLGVPDERSKAPVTLFLSHAKVDLNVEPLVTQRVINHLKEDQPVEAWVDSGNIPAGSEFAKAIEQGVQRTSLLVVLTDNYATREWCREEVLLAKENHRPVAVIDALTKYEVRSFPYLGNVPTVRWDGCPETGVDLLLKETLRHLHTTAILNQSKRPGDFVFVRPPELATLVGLDPGITVLYPDPPIGVGEARRLAKAKVPFTTPLQRLAADRPLNGRLIAMSMSESTDGDRQGLDQLHLERSMLELSRYLLIKGATLAYGGHLGDDGYTVKLFELVRTHNAREGVAPFHRIVNHRGWPLPRLSVEKLAELNQVSRTLELPRPADIDETLNAEFKLEPSGFPGDKSAIHRYAWARGMTAMREFQANSKQSGVVARVVLGGKFGPTTTVVEGAAPKKQWYASRIPGVLEEILLSAKADQPVFLIGAFGGVARLAIDLLQGKDRDEAIWNYQQQAPFAPGMRQLYETRGPAWWDYPDMVQFLRDKGIAGINRLLNEEEHRELFETIDPWRMVEIVLQGLGRL
jgi:hypothetical protein